MHVQKRGSWILSLHIAVLTAALAFATVSTGAGETVVPGTTTQAHLSGRERNRTHTPALAGPNTEIRNCGPDGTSGEMSAAGILASKLKHFVDENVMAGAVMAVANKDRVLDLEAVGYADISVHRPMRSDDLFWIASMTKSVTAVAFMMLVDQHLVRVDDPVAKFVPGFKGLKVVLPTGEHRPPSRPVLIRDLLSHTGGMRFLNSSDAQQIDSVPLTVSIEHDLSESLLFDPGTKYSYSNEGIDVIGHVIERVSGMPYERFLKERLFSPLGLDDTTFSPTPEQLKRLARCYRSSVNKSGLEETQIHYLSYPLEGKHHYPAPGGGLFSTAADVTRFCQMLANGGVFHGRRYLSAALVHQMTVKQTEPKLRKEYGFGFDVTSGGFGHGGACKTNMRVDSDGRIFIFLVQQASPWTNADPLDEFMAAARESFPLETAERRN